MQYYLDARGLCNLAEVGDPGQSVQMSLAMPPERPCMATDRVDLGVALLRSSQCCRMGEAAPRFCHGERLF